MRCLLTIFEGHRELAREPRRVDRWVVVTGGPGMGKSAILSAWLGRREAAGAVVPHHFIRRGAYDWDAPAQMVNSPVAQLDERFPDAREPETGARMHPAARLGKALSRVSEQELGPCGERLVVLIDGLDEYDPPVGTLPGDPLAAFLPHAAAPRGEQPLVTTDASPTHRTRHSARLVGCDIGVGRFFLIQLVGFCAAAGTPSRGGLGLEQIEQGLASS